jgi:hypothetical protein
VLQVLLVPKEIEVLTEQSDLRALVGQQGLQVLKGIQV